MTAQQSEGHDETDLKGMETQRRRKAPLAYETLIPLALGLIVVALVVLLLLTIGIALRLFPGVM